MSATGFLDNHIEIRVSGALVAASTADVWWNNPVDANHTDFCRIDGVASADCGGSSSSSVQLRGSADDNVLTRVVASGGFYMGLLIHDSDYNSVSQLTTVNNGFYGLHLESGARWNNVTHVTVADNGLRGVFITGGSHTNRLTQFATINNGDVVRR